MKTRYIKQLFSAALTTVLSLGVTSCINDLDISPIDPQTGGSFDQQGVFVKGYAMLGVTGQKGIDGSPDLDGQDEGESGFYRTTFNCNELPTDECLWAWQENQDIPQLTSISWSPSSQRTEWVYVRLGYDITQYNFFLDQTEGMTEAETLRSVRKYVSCVPCITGTSSTCLEKLRSKNTSATIYLLKRKVRNSIPTFRMN
mgnify:CR=1 FL=1